MISLQKRKSEAIQLDNNVQLQHQQPQTQSLHQQQQIDGPKHVPKRKRVKQNSSPQAVKQAQPNGGSNSQTKTILKLSNYKSNKQNFSYHQHHMSNNLSENQTCQNQGVYPMNSKRASGDSGELATDSDESIWIFGLINNIEQLLSACNANNAAVINQRRQQHHQTHQQPQLQQRRHQQASCCSGSSTPSSLASNGTLNYPSSSPSDSPRSSSGSFGANSSSQVRAAAASLASLTSQQPRQPSLSRPIKFHEYKGPPPARRQTATSNQQQAASSSSSSSSQPATSSSATQAQAAISCKIGWAPSDEFSKQQQMQPHLQAQMSSQPQLQYLVAKTPGASSQTSLVKLLIESPISSEAATTAEVAATVAAPVAETKFHSNFEGHGDELADRQPADNLAAPRDQQEPRPIAVSENSSDIKHQQQLLLHESQPMEQPEHLKLSQGQQQGVLRFALASPENCPAGSEFKAAPKGTHIMQQQQAVYSNYSQSALTSQQQQHQFELESNQKLNLCYSQPSIQGPFGAPRLANYEPQISSQQGPNRTLTFHAQPPSLQQRPEDQSQSNLLPLGANHEHEQAAEHVTLDVIEPTINFGGGFDELLFSEFIDLQDVPLNVDESDWLKKFLPPCSMS